jgi:hypothetical protein
MPPIVISGIRGRNGTDNALMLPDWACSEAYNVDFDGTHVASRRGGSIALATTFASGGPFVGPVGSLLTHVPGTAEAEAELWGFDAGSTVVGRLAGQITWRQAAAIDAHTDSINVTGASLGGFFWLTYNSAVNRSQVWDTSLLRRRGFATPGTPTRATLGGAGNTFTRFYRVRWVSIVGADRVRQSEPSPSVTLTITDDSGIRVTRPTAASEGETHWDVEYADSDAGPWYVAGTVVIATTTYDDTEATIDTTNDLSAVEGDHMPPPSWKINVKSGARLLCAGCWETSAGSSFVPLNNEVYWTPVLGESDIGDLERQPISYRVALDHPVTAISEAINGNHWVFGYRGMSSLTPAGSGESAYSRFTERLDLGCLRQQAQVIGDDEFGQSALYFLSHRGPYRITSRGMQYLGRDIEDVWDTVNLDAASVTATMSYDADEHCIYVWLATETDTYPDARLRFFTQLGHADGDEVRGGWVRDTGHATVGNVVAATAFASTVGTLMSARRSVYTSYSVALGIFKTNIGTDDNGNDFKAYVETKEYSPAGLGQNCSLGEMHIVAEAGTNALAHVTFLTDFGRQSLEAELISLAPEYAETSVQKPIKGQQVSDIGTIRFKIGDATETDPGFGTIAALFVPFTPGSRR